MSDYKKILLEKINSMSLEETRKLLNITCEYIPESSYPMIFKNLNIKIKIDLKELKNTKNMCNELLESVESYCPDGYYDYGWDYDNCIINHDGGFSNDFNRCLKKVLKFFNDGFYLESSELFYILLQIIDRFDDYFMDEIFGIENLYDEGYIPINEKGIALHYCFCVLQAQDFCSEKLEKIYRVLYGNSSTINDVINLKDFPIARFNDFLYSWKEYLVSLSDEVSNERITTKFLYEVVILEKDEKILERYVIKAKTTYPYYCLVEYCFKKHSYSSVIKYAKEAIAKKHLSKEHLNDIINILIETALLVSDKTLYKESILDKHINNSCINNFVTIYNDYNEKAMFALGLLEKKDFDYTLARFALGHYEETFAKIKNDNKSLGWSSSSRLKGTLIPLLIYLIGNFEDNLVYIRKSISLSDDYIKISRENHVLNSENEKREYFNYCYKEVSLRAVAIMGGKFRSSYYKVAQLVYALAEASKYVGEDAETIIREYETKYSRFRAFRQELDNVAKLGVRRAVEN